LAQLLQQVKPGAFFGTQCTDGPEYQYCESQRIFAAVIGRLYGP